MSEDRCPVCAELGHAACVEAAVEESRTALRALNAFTTDTQTRLCAVVDQRDARIAELERLVVWMAKHQAVRRQHQRLHRLEWLVGDSQFYAAQFDGTDEDLIRAAIAAMKERE